MGSFLIRMQTANANYGQLGGDVDTSVTIHGTRPWLSFLGCRGLVPRSLTLASTGDQTAYANYRRLGGDVETNVNIHGARPWLSFLGCRGLVPRSLTLASTGDQTAYANYGQLGGNVDTNVTIHGARPGHSFQEIDRFGDAAALSRGTSRWFLQTPIRRPTNRSNLQNTSRKAMKTSCLKPVRQYSYDDFSMSPDPTPGNLGICANLAISSSTLTPFGSVLK